jgi:hypothetical protein
LKRLFLQPNSLFSAAQFSSLQVEFKDAKPEAYRKRVFYGLGDVVPAGLTANGPALYCKRPLPSTYPWSSLADRGGASITRSARNVLAINGLVHFTAVSPSFHRHCIVGAGHPVHTRLIRATSVANGTFAKQRTVWRFDHESCNLEVDYSGGNVTGQIIGFTSETGGKVRFTYANSSYTFKADGS